MFDYTQPAGAEVGQGGQVAEVGNTDGIMQRRVEDARPFRRADGGPVDRKIHFLSHRVPSFTGQ